MNQTKRTNLYRGPRAIAGVCSGIAQYFNVDVVILRIAWVVLSFFSAGLAAVLYVLLWIIIPKDPALDKTVVDVSPTSVQSDKYQDAAFTANASDGIKSQRGGGQRSSAHTGDKQKQETSSVGLAVLLGLGLVLFFAMCARVSTLIVPGIHFFCFFPLIFVALGVVIVAIPANRWSFAMRICGFLFCLELCFILLPFSLRLVPLEALHSLSMFALMLWIAVACLLIISLVSPSEGIVIALVCVAAVAVLVSFIDTGVFERIATLISMNPPHKKSI